MFFRKFISNRNKKIKVKVNKLVYLGLSEISKTLMYEFWYDYIKPKYQQNGNLCYMDTDRFLFILKLKMFMNILQMMLKKI